MDHREELLFVLVGVVVIIVLITGGWLSGQMAMAVEICREAGFSSGEYDKPKLICSQELKLDINMTTDKATP